MATKKFSKTYDEVLIQSYLFQSEFVADQTELTANSPLFASPFADDFLDDIEAADDIPTNEDDLNFQTLNWKLRKKWHLQGRIIRSFCIM
jgi:hypothetical protein